VGGGKRCQRHLTAGFVRHIQFENIFGRRAIEGIGLHHHALQSPAIGEIVDDRRAIRGGQC
jgi:hypothetical protein